MTRLVGVSKKRAALDRLLAMVPALEASGAEPMSEDEIAARAGVFGQVRLHRNGRLMERGLNRRQEWESRNYSAEYGLAVYSALRELPKRLRRNNPFIRRTTEKIQL